jgi:hypothetical protein
MGPFRLPAAAAAALLVFAVAVPAAGDSSSIAGAGQGGWTTPPGGSLQDAPIAVTRPGGAVMPPPAPPAREVVPAQPYLAPSQPYTAPGAPCAPPVAAAPERTWSGCGLPCSDGISQWHVRGVLGRAWTFGDDEMEDCWYWGFDVGRTFCGCWGLDLFYRYHSGQFDRNNPPQPTVDGGEFHHVGAKFTYDFPISGKIYGWAGVGPEYWWTSDYLNDDSGFGVFAELGVGYVFNRNIRLRAGVNIHGLDTDVTRVLPANDGDSRWLWVVAPVVELEWAF